jgi:HEAT repeat protein
VTPYLITLLDERYFLAATRGRKLKTAIADCLGRLGDPRAVPILKKLASESGGLGSACSGAIALIEKSEGKSDGNS